MWLLVGVLAGWLVGVMKRGGFGLRWDIVLGPDGVRRVEGFLDRALDGALAARLRDSAWNPDHANGGDSRGRGEALRQSRVGGEREDERVLEIPGAPSTYGGRRADREAQRSSGPSLEGEAS
jgi:hypothetical protein